MKIKEKEYKVLQRLEKYNTNLVLKIIELKNKNLATCSNDSSIIFYSKDNSEFKFNFKIIEDGGCYTIIQTKENEVCYSMGNNKSICFYDFIEKKKNLH